MTTLLSKEEMVKGYATNKIEADYINNLGEVVFEQLQDVEEFIENNTFQSILNQSLTISIMTIDFKTQELMENSYPDQEYNMIHETGENWEIKMDDKGLVKAIIYMTENQYKVMTEMETLEDLKHHIYTNNVADEVIIADFLGRTIQLFYRS